MYDDFHLVIRSYSHLANKLRLLYEIIGRNFEQTKLIGRNINNHIDDNKWLSIIIYVKNFHYICCATTILDDMETDINRLKVVLAEKKRTNKWLCEQLGVNPSTVSKWCTNSSQPDLQTLVKIARLLEVTVDELLNNKIEL